MTVFSPEQEARIRAIVRDVLAAEMGQDDFARRISELVGLKPLADLPPRDAGEAPDG